MTKLKVYLKIFWVKFNYLLNLISLTLIIFYRKVFSPSVGLLRYIPFYPKPSCIFYPTCSEYGIECFKKYFFLKAFKKTILRIIKCHPKNDPQVDLP